jgi:hypothetical protein
MSAIIIAAILATLALGILRLVGVFHKGAADIAEITIAVISGLKPSRKNFFALPRKILSIFFIRLKKKRLLYKILRRHAYKRLRAQREAQEQQKSPLQ